MSLLDTLKGLICNFISNKPASEQQSPRSEKVEKPAAPKAEAKPEPVVKPEPESKTKPVSTKSPAVAKKEKIAPATPETSTATTLQIPEDSTLRRHFISSLKAEIESKMPPRPSDSTLKRHYDAKVQAELNDLLDT